MQARASLTWPTWTRVRDSAGFTLVEVLVAMVLLGLISLTLFSSFRFGVRAWEAGTARVEQLGELEVVQNLIRNELTEAVQLPVDSGALVPESTFVGAPGELRFSGPLPVHLGMGGTHVFTLSSTGTGRDRGLTLRWQLYRPDMLIDGEGWSDPVVLIAGISDLELAYFGAEKDDELPTWRDSWKDQETLPELIRLRVKFEHADPRWWPDLVVAPQVAQAGDAQ